MISTNSLNNETNALPPMLSKKNPTNLLMIRPIAFGFNTETATSNAFQNLEFGNKNKNLAQEKALIEFDTFVEKLRNIGVNVTVIEDTLQPYTPDSIFPNNWISFHEDGTLVTYPMQAKNRRLERREDIIETIKTKFEVKNKIDLSDFEASEKYLEGTGSMVLDRANNIAYACLSPRTNLEVLQEFGKKLAYKIIAFDAADMASQQIYHTNVMMCVASDFVVICLEAIPNIMERKMVVDTIIKSGKQIIEITLPQMNCFAGNMLEVTGNNASKYLVMSSLAHKSLDSLQIAKIESFATILHSDLTMIEGNGGGSARCMMAEVCLPIL